LFIIAGWIRLKRKIFSASHGRIPSYEKAKTILLERATGQTR
jgi:hypothetical protein